MVYNKDIFVLQIPGEPDDSIFYEWADSRVPASGADEEGYGHRGGD